MEVEMDPVLTLVMSVIALSVGIFCRIFEFAEKLPDGIESISSMLWGVFAQVFINFSAVAFFASIYFAMLPK